MPNDAPGDVEIDLGGGGGGGGGSSGGGSSGSSSGGGSSGPPVDPVIAQKISAFASAYFQLWGEPATQAYLRGAAQKGLSLPEFMWRERYKKEYLASFSARQKAEGLAKMLHDLGAR